MLRSAVCSRAANVADCAGKIARSDSYILKARTRQKCEKKYMKMPFRESRRGGRIRPTRERSERRGTLSMSRLTTTPDECVRGYVFHVYPEFRFPSRCFTLIG